MISNLLLGVSWFNDQVTIPEILWFVMGLVGAFFAYGNLREALNSLDALAARGKNGITRAIGLGHARTEAGRLLIHLTTMLIGGAAMLTPPTNPDRPVSALAIIVLVGLFIINIVTILQSVLDRRLRNAVERDLQDEIEMKVGERVDEIQEAAQREADG